jgi:aryl-alcohol dehydrogenase-like predicted oxidoreductase
MRYRKLGSTGFKVSEIGYGAWGIGEGEWKGSSEEKAFESLNLAIDNGVNFIDTALGYGEGKSEEIVGEAVRKRDERVYIGTKVPPKNDEYVPGPEVPVEEAYPKDWILEATEKSLENLGQDKIDFLQLHVWVDEWAKSDGWKEAVSELKDSGMISSFGLSLVFPFPEEEPNYPARAIGTGLIDACNVVYNIYEQEKPQENLFPLAEEEEVGVIAKSPLDEGALTGKITPETEFPEDDWRNWYFREDRKEEVYQRAQDLEWMIEEGEVESLPEGALRFGLSHSAVSTVIVGMRSPKHVEENVSTSDKGPLPKSYLERLEDHAWHHNYWA